MCSATVHLFVSLSSLTQDYRGITNFGTPVFTCGLGMLLSMVLINFATSEAGTGASFGIYAIALSFGPTSVIDSIRTTLWHQSVFGSAYALKVTMNNA
jgi:hypothetical protein